MNKIDFMKTGTKFQVCLEFVYIPTLDLYSCYFGSLDMKILGMMYTHKSSTVYVFSCKGFKKSGIPPLNYEAISGTKVDLSIIGLVARQSTGSVCLSFKFQLSSWMVRAVHRRVVILVSILRRMQLPMLSWLGVRFCLNPCLI